MYQIKEMYYTLQGEGARAGRPSVFCRFTGCNLWSGREKDRSEAVCNFCDTDFVGVDGPGGGKFADSLELSTAIALLWPNEELNKYIVFTGGEPGLQLNDELIDQLHSKNFEVAVETNGTLHLPTNIDWLNLLISGLGVPDPKIVTLITSENMNEEYAKSIGIKKNLIV